MKALAWLCYITMFSIVWEQSDVSTAINVVAVSLLATIAWLIKRGINGFEQRLESIDQRQTSTDRRLRVAELNMEKVAASMGIKARRYIDPEDSDKDLEKCDGESQ